MNCPACQKENPPASRFCNGCGTSLAPVCPGCAHENIAGARFCNQCGTALGAAATEDVVAAVTDSSAATRFVPKRLAEKILATRGTIEGERRQVTVMFCDLAGSTHITEELGAEGYRELLADYLEHAIRCVHRYEGVVNQLAGDGFMAIFGAPIAHDNDAERAAHAALDIQTEMSALADRWEDRLSTHLDARIGLHSGPVIVGAVGSDLHMEYSAIGDTTNVAARIEAFAPAGTVCVSGATRKLIAQRFETAEIGRESFKGKSEKIELYRLVREITRSERRHQALRSGLSKFLGRHAEVGLLLDRYGEAREGRGQVMFIGGDAGIGKSRLAYEFRRQLAPDSYYWLEGQCISHGAETPLLPLTDMLRGVFEIDESDASEEVIEKVRAFCRRHGGQVEEGEAIYRDMLGIDSGDPKIATMEKALKNGFYYAAVRDLVHTLSLERPVVWLIEDLHWMDQSSERILRRFFDTIAESRIQVIVTHRPEYRWPHAERGYFSRIGLRGLGGTLVGELAEGVAGGRDIPKSIQEAIAARADGNPFFIEEVAKSLIEQGALDDPDAISSLVVPSTVQEVIQARIDRLDDRSKRTLQIASVIGREFTVRVLERAAQVDTQDPETLDSLQDLELIYEKRIHPELAYMFKHALTHDVAYDTLLERERRELHGRVGRLIEELYPDRLAEFYDTLAQQFSAAGDKHKAAFYYLAAGKRAAAILALEASAHLKRAIEFSTDEPDLLELHLDALTVLGMLNMRLGYVDEANELFRRGAELAADPGLRESLLNRIAERRFIDREGVKIAYYVCGTRHDPDVRTPLVCFHPLIQGSIAFQDAAQHFCQTRPVVFCDPRSVGASEGSQDYYSHEERVADAAEVVRDVGYQQMILYGDSDGTRLALEVHKAFLDRVERIILFGFAGEGAGDDGVPLGFSKNAFESYVHKILEADYDTMLANFFLLMFNEPGSESWREFVTESWKNSFSEDLARGFLKSAVSADLRGLLKLVPESVPLLLLSAERDAILPERVRRLCAYAPHAEFGMIMGSGHMAPFTRVDVFCEILEAFIATDKLPKEQWATRAA